MKYKYVKSEASKHDMKLIQLGAKVEQINGTMCYVKFDIEGYELSYVYNINKKGKYFLERIKPYPLPIKAYKKESEVIDTIKIDLEQFKNAVKSSNIEAFVTISTELNRTIKQFEDLFLYYNVPKIETQIILGKISEIQKQIKSTKDDSKRVFFNKEPDNL